MKVIAELNGVKVTREIPTRWEQITFQNFLDLAQIGNDTVKLISYFTQVPEDTLKKAKIRNLDAILTSISFLNVMPDIETVPDKILGYPLPKDLELEEIGRYEALKKYIVQMQEMDKNEVIKLYPFMVATYAMREYDPIKVEEFAKEFYNAPCSEVMAIGNFTLAKLSGLKINSSNPYPWAVILPKKSRQVIKIWLTNLAFSVRFYLWKKRHRIKETNS